MNNLTGIIVGYSDDGIHYAWDFSVVWETRESSESFHSWRISFCNDELQIFLYSLIYKDFRGTIDLLLQRFSKLGKVPLISPLTLLPFLYLILILLTAISCKAFRSNIFNIYPLSPDWWCSSSEHLTCWNIFLRVPSWCQDCKINLCSLQSFSMVRYDAVW